MERYQAEVLIPFLIGLVFLFTFFHLRRNKRLRREELFRESMSFSIEFHWIRIRTV